MTKGCGNSNCDNKNCASNPNISNLTNNEAALLAIQLAKQKAPLCDTSSKSSKQLISGENSSTLLSSFPSTSNIQPNTIQTNNDTLNINNDNEEQMSDEEDNDVVTPSTSKIDFNQILPPQSTNSLPTTSQNIEYLTETIQNLTKDQNKNLKFLNEKEITNRINLCKEELNSNHEDKMEIDQSHEKTSCTNNLKDLIELLKFVFQSYKSLAYSFQFENDEDNLLKTSMPDKTPQFNIDFSSLRRSYSILFNSLPDDALNEEIENAVNTSVITLCYGIKMMLKKSSINDEELDELLRALLIVYELPILEDPKYMDKCAMMVYSVISELPVNASAKIVRLWSTWDSEELNFFLNKLQQYITVYAISKNLDEESQRNNEEEEIINHQNCLHKSEAIVGAVACSRLIYYASIFGGRLDPVEQIKKEREIELEETKFLEELSFNQEENNIYNDPLHTLSYRTDPLEEVLNIRPIDCREPKIPSDQFLNEIINKFIDIQHDYVEYIQQVQHTQTADHSRLMNSSNKNKKHFFSFLANPFILILAKKNLGLYYDNKIKMLRERRSNMLMSLLEGSIPMPYFKMRLQRNNLLLDALSLIELQEQENASILRKQLFIEFENEQGIDQGGVSKEFFQLAIDELLNKGYSKKKINF